MRYKSKTFLEKDFEDIDFAGDEFWHCEFVGEIRMAIFKECKFVSCDFRKVMFLNGNIDRCRFVDCQIAGVSFEKMVVNLVEFENCVLKESIFGDPKSGSDMKKSSFLRCDLESVIFYRLDLEKSNFEECEMKTASFESCDLRLVKMTRSNLNGINWGKSKINKTTIDLNGFLSIGMSLGFVLEE
jgi:uncharacterized protein YjbI with pentapeptide repeats